MNYRYGDEIEVTIDREGLGLDEGIGHLPDETMVVIAGAGGKVGESIHATIVAIQTMALGSSVLAYAKA